MFTSTFGCDQTSVKQTNDIAKGKLHVGSSYVCCYTFRGCYCQSAAGSMWGGDETLSVGCGHLLTQTSNSWNNISNSTHIPLLYLGTFEYLSQKLCLLHKLEDTAITFPHVTDFINY